MATEFELSVTGSTRNMLDAIGVLADKLINLDTIATAKVDDRYVIRFLTGCEEECRTTFMKADLPFTERKVLVLDVHDRPGQWLRAARCLMDQGIELEESYLLTKTNGKLRFVFGVSDYQRAKAIASQMTDCSTD
ncbi:MAG: hypothetical protein KKE24_03895 [Candidatus Thermoplasmatota archaeon]|nr:hypothetical protein [Candidatus Thermoplasmatota archaeon]